MSYYSFYVFLRAKIIIIERVYEYKFILYDYWR